MHENGKSEEEEMRKKILILSLGLIALISSFVIVGRNRDINQTGTKGCKITQATIGHTFKPIKMSSAKYKLIPGEFPK